MCIMSFYIDKYDIYKITYYLIRRQSLKIMLLFDLQQALPYHLRSAVLVCFFQDYLQLKHRNTFNTLWQLPAKWRDSSHLSQKLVFRL